MFFQQLINGLTTGSVYALIALGYTMIYGILGLINFAQGEIYMCGAFVTVLLLATGKVNFYLACAAGMAAAALLGVVLERVAFRPLRGCHPLVPLISAIGASIFIENAFQLLFGPQRRDYINPTALQRGAGWTVHVGGGDVIITYTGVLTIVLSILIMIGLYLLVQRSRLGRAMRAVAENKQVAALMGINVDRVISQTFVISGVLAGAAGVMWGLHLSLVYYFVGFVPGIKAFTAAVLGGIGNIPGAMLGGLFLGIVESLGPAVLGISFQLKDVLAFAILVLILIFRPTGILGEVLTEAKV
jgi:branched-chain amino acid transport system permease protein